MSDPRFLQDGFDKRLSHLIEEIGEALAAAGKTQRWGAWSTNPLLPPAQRESNLTWLVRELTDVRQAIDRLEESIGLEFTGDGCRFVTSSAQETAPTLSERMRDAGFKSRRRAAIPDEPEGETGSAPLTVAEAMDTCAARAVNETGWRCACGEWMPPEHENCTECLKDRPGLNREV